jgi:hypothetical protein
MALYSLVLVPTHPMRVTRILPLPTQVLGARDPATSLLAVLELCVSKPSLSCIACRIALYRGGKAGAERAARGHYCEPVLPLGRRRRPA